MTAATSNFILIPVLGVAAGCCVWAGASAYRWRGRRAHRGETAIWAGFAVLLLAFIAVRVGGLVTVVGNAARDTLRQDGLYNDRRTLQVAAVVAAALGLVAGLWQIRQIMTRWRRYGWALLGSAVLVGSGVIRAISLHEIDALGPWLKVMVEAPAAIAVAGGALARVRGLATAGEGGGPE